MRSSIVLVVAVAALAVAPARATFMPTKKATQVMATLNATKNAVAAEVQLKTLAGVTTDATLARFTGTVTCYLDDATGDVVGLQFGFAAPLCTNTGTTRTFTVPADGYIASMKVAVDPKTDWIGQVAFTIKSNSSLAPTNVITCGSRGVVGVDVMPKLTALASVSGACRPASAAGRRLAQSAVGLDPASLRISVTSIAAADGAVPLVSCLKTVTDQLVLAASPFFVPIQMTVTAVGGGGGAGGNINGCSGGGGSSAVVINGSPVVVAAGGAGAGFSSSGNNVPGDNGAVVTQAATLPAGAPLSVYVGGGGSAASLSGGAGAAGFFGGGGGGAIDFNVDCTAGGGGYTSGGAAGASTTGAGLPGASLAGGSGGDYSGDYALGGTSLIGGAIVNPGGNSGSGGAALGAGGGGCDYRGGVVPCVVGSNASLNGLTSGYGGGGLGTATWAAATDVPPEAGLGGAQPGQGIAGGADSAGGNAGIVIINYVAPACLL